MTTAELVVAMVVRKKTDLNLSRLSASIVQSITQSIYYPARSAIHQGVQHYTERSVYGARNTKGNLCKLAARHILVLCVALAKQHAPHAPVSVGRSFGIEWETVC